MARFGVRSVKALHRQKIEFFGDVRSVKALHRQKSSKMEWCKVGEGVTPSKPSICGIDENYIFFELRDLGDCF